MIKLENASFSYIEGKYIFQNINLSLPQGKTLTILGSNGIGKTTILKCIAGLFPLTEGICSIVNKNNLKPKISYVPQGKKLNISYDILDFISFGRSSLHSYFKSPTKEDYEISKEMMSKLSIGFLQNKKINEISGGELQLCYIAKALVSDPNILILDEPESNLDFKNQKIILNLLNDLSKNHNITIIMNTHFINNALNISEYCLLMKNNNCYKYGESKNILTKENLEYIYEVPVYRSYYEDNENLIGAFIV